MGASNDAWGQLAAYDDELAEVWDGFEPLPDPGENKALDALCAAKGITIPALVRLGARLSAPTVLAFAYPGGIKYRDLVTGRRWNFYGSSFEELKIVRAGAASAETCIVCEGETDAAWLSERYPDADIAALPAGARRFTPKYAEQLRGYRQVLAALDNDESGEAGAEKILQSVPNSARFAPPEGANDWCEVEEPPALPDPAATAPAAVLVSAGDLLELEVPEQASWFEHDLLPIGGQLILHGWAKSYKSFLALDMLAALAQGEDWCGFEPIEEPCRVAVIQFEIPWPYYRQRVNCLIGHARQPQLFRENFLTYAPLRRPELRAGNRKSEDAVIANLVGAGVQVVLIDPIRRITGAIDMNAEGEVRHTLGFFERMQNEGITVVATHHDNKEGAKAGGGDPLTMTGSGAWSGDADTIVSVQVPKGHDQESPRRNLRFLLRNAPAIGARAMEMQDDGTILYSPEPAGDWNDEKSANTPTLPSI